MSQQSARERLEDLPDEDRWIANNRYASRGQLAIRLAALGFRAARVHSKPRARRGRPLGALDSYDRVAAHKEALDLHAALMRERFGAIEDLEREVRMLTLAPL